jgi:hypothetical protein
MKQKPTTIESLLAFAASALRALRRIVTALARPGSGPFLTGA